MLLCSGVELPATDGSFVERLVQTSHTVSDKLSYFGPEMPPSAIAGLKGDRAESTVVISYSGLYTDTHKINTFLSIHMFACFFWLYECVCLDQAHKQRKYVNCELAHYLFTQSKLLTKARLTPTAICWTATSELYVCCAEGFLLLVDPESLSVSVLFNLRSKQTYTFISTIPSTYCLILLCNRKDI